MVLLQVVLFLMMCAVALGWVARHFKFPYPIALVIGGALLGFVPRLPQLQFDPQFLLVLVLPPILYQAALLTSWHEFKANIRPIGLLAIGLVIATTLAVGATLKLLIPDIPWAAAFVLGAIVSPPDVAAATAILSRLNIPRNVVTVLEGESLVNDASGLVIYKFAVAAVLTGAFSLWEASVQFVGVAVGGVVIGVVMGRLFVFIHRYLGDAFIEVLTTLAVPYVTYIIAESLDVAGVHASGVLAVVAAGIVRGRYSPEIVSAEMRIIARSVWNLLVFLLNTLIFILIGVQLSGIIGRLTDYSLGELFFYGTFVSAVAIFVRFAWVYPATYLPLVVRAMLGEQVAPPREGEVFIMGWCGMRGIVSLAAALALPQTLQDGSPFPERDLIIFLTFVVIAVTLVLQGLTLKPLIRMLKVGRDWSLQEEQQRAQMALGKAAIAAIDAVAAKDGISNELAERIRAEFAEKITLSVPGGLVLRHSGADDARRLRDAAVKAERQELIRLWRENQISDEVLHHIEEDLDYQESRI
ncbi:MAG: Na+/H+ antiporter [Betaproteobacteria bacterium]|nr:MAG: Na+/H+ antiporter [Betaproteobacteria bacterium]